MNNQILKTLNIYCGFKNLLFLGLVLCIPLNLNAGLSVQTANTIEGTKPYILLDGNTLSDLDELLVFQVGTSPTKIGVDDSLEVNPANFINIPKNLTFNDIKLFVEADGNIHSINSLAKVSVDDDDGDVFIDPLGQSTASVSGNISAKFEYVKTSQQVTDLARHITPCDGDIKLTLAITNNVFAQTTFGDPRQSDIYTGVKNASYMLRPQGYDLCYIRPLSMVVSSSNTVYPGGYNDDVWEYDSVSNVHKGFSVSKLKGKGQTFPTSGFDQAQFTLVGSTNNGKVQSDYSCDVTVGSWVTTTTASAPYNGQNCTITFNSSARPTGAINIAMKLKSTGELVANYSFDFDDSTKTLWAIAGDFQKVNAVIPTLTAPNRATFVPYTDAKMMYNDGAYNHNYEGYYHAAYACDPNSNLLLGKTDINDAGKYFFSRKELTNVASAFVGIDSLILDWNEHFSRSLGSFQGEWGKLNSYQNSPWPLDNTAVFTSELAFDGVGDVQYQAIVHNNPQGTVAIYQNPRDKVYVICKR